MLEGKVAIVTGASRGIGRATAECFHRHGANLVLVARTASLLEEVAASMNRESPRAICVVGDVAAADTAAKAVRGALETFKRVDVLVNVAGQITRDPFDKLPYETWQRILEINLGGHFHMCQAVLAPMRAAGAGSIINMSSQMAYIPHPAASPSYEASKSAINALTRHMALHYAKDGIRVNAIAPGSIETTLAASMNPEARQALAARIPIGRLGLPDEVATCALFLAGNHSSYVTGTTIHVNGGSLII